MFYIKLLRKTVATESSLGFSAGPFLLMAFKRHQLPRKDIAKLFKNGRRVRVAAGMLILTKTGNQPTRYVCIVPNTTAPQASKRNRIRRMAQERIRKCGRLPETGYDLVLIIGGHLAKATRKVFYQKLDEVFSLFQAAETRFRHTSGRM
ncbi:MAG: hypothetical protein A2633_02735 [Candidatus Sungbacteria bacterium RIFCSPHIGHO2_01_FULL_47_32]|uniref:RNase P protein n=1 Tax=Candidatus Sungbacteria bacterium RIFCSPHIGHO2_01_FULL_47_32 TaxID=1802264 RepID=A0A1G2K2V4_9BACT|nr:MAG: hypothetical protein A2633_02735 [Candidatus Sungbacteria bacterium RIFCSPHIGHO2_01_FULL_47_32]